MNGIDLLYRFEPENEDRITSLVSNQLWFSDPQKFNDPFDFNVSIKDVMHQNGYYIENIRLAVHNIFKDQSIEKSHWMFDNKVLDLINLWGTGDQSCPIEHIIECTRSHLNSFGVQCFMGSLDNQLAWAHYGSSHKGFCIEYSFNSMHFASNPNFSQYPVTYTSQKPEICISEILFTPHQALAKYIATKSTEWSYEQEYRLINFENKGKAVDMPQGIKINKLIAGFKMNHELKNLLRKTAKTLQITFDEMIVEKGNLILQSESKS